MEQEQTKTTVVDCLTLQMKQTNIECMEIGGNLRALGEYCPHLSPLESLNPVTWSLVGGNSSPTLLLLMEDLLW